MPAPNVKNLTEWLGPHFQHEGHDPIASAKLLAAEIKSASTRKQVDNVLELADKMLDASGAEAIRGDFHGDSYYQDIVGLYVNMGDSYVATLLYDTVAGRFVVTTWGDWVTSHTKKYGIE